MTATSLQTAGISLTILAMTTEGATLLQAAPPAWLALGAVAAFAAVLRRTRRC